MSLEIPFSVIPVGRTDGHTLLQICEREEKKKEGSQEGREEWKEGREKEKRKGREKM